MSTGNQSIDTQLAKHMHIPILMTELGVEMATRAKMISESEAIYRLNMDRIKLSTVDDGTELVRNAPRKKVEAIYRKVESDSMESISIGKSDLMFVSGKEPPSRLNL